MNYQTIEEYFTQFTDDVEEIKVQFISNHLPDLSRFYKLKVLFCSNIQLTCLPPLPSTLERLNCSYNKLTHLPPLPSSLESLDCSYNKLSSLPPLPSTLVNLVCCYNKLTCLPPLPSTLINLYCFINQLTCLPPLPSGLKRLDCYYNSFQYYYDFEQNERSMTDFITEMQIQLKIINRFRELFYALKYKKQFLDWLWVRIREPKIRIKYHPDNLMKMLEGREEMTLDELDELIENW